MSTTRRTRIGRWNDIATRTVVYKSDHGIEVDELDRFEIIRRRVFYDDMLLVTWHRQPATGHALLLVLAALLFALTTIFLLPVSTPAALSVGAVACGIAVLAIVVYVRGVDILTFFGRRSTAAVRYVWRKRRARSIYGEICAATAAAQRRRAAEIAASEPAEAIPKTELPPLPPQDEAPDDVIPGGEEHAE